MPSAPSHSGEMPQGFRMTDRHRSRVTRSDGVARTSRRAYEDLAASAIGLELGVAVIIGLFFGRWLDGELGTSPWLMIVFVAIGFAAGILAVVRGVRRADAAAARDDRDPTDEVPRG
jgi:F0F1-type ATP synthase assembly protein I